MELLSLFWINQMVYESTFWSNVCFTFIANSNPRMTMSITVCNNYLNIDLLSLESALPYKDKDVTRDGSVLSMILSELLFRINQESLHKDEDDWTRITDRDMEVVFPSNNGTGAGDNDVAPTAGQHSSYNGAGDTDVAPTTGQPPSNNGTNPPPSMKDVGQLVNNLTNPQAIALDLCYTSVKVLDRSKGGRRDFTYTDIKPTFYEIRAAWKNNLIWKENISFYVILCVLPGAGLTPHGLNSVGACGVSISTCMHSEELVIGFGIKQARTYDRILNYILKKSKSIRILDVPKEKAVVMIEEIGRRRIQVAQTLKREVSRQKKRPIVEVVTLLPPPKKPKVTVLNGPFFPLGPNGSNCGVQNEVSSETQETISANYSVQNGLSSETRKTISQSVLEYLVFRYNHQPFWFELLEMLGENRKKIGHSDTLLSVGIKRKRGYGYESEEEKEEDEGIVESLVPKKRKLN